MTDSGLVIEFFGAAGAGKTFVAQSVAEYLRRQGIEDVLLLRETLRPRRFSQEWLRSGLGSRARMIRHPVYAARLLSAIRATGQANFRECRRLLMGWFKTEARLKRFRRQYSVTLQDHGCFQALWTIGYGATPEGWSRVMPEFLRLILPPDLLVIVDADPATAIRRLQQRRQSQGSTSRIQNDDLDSDQTRNRLADLTAQILDAVVPSASAQFGFPVLRLDNDRDEYGAWHAEQLAEAIAQCLRSRPCASPHSIVSTYTKRLSSATAYARQQEISSPCGRGPG